jgi:hypothetical protein
MVNNLLRIGILLVLGLVTLNIIRQTNLFGMGAAATNVVESVTSAQEKLLGANARMETGPSYDMTPESAGVRPHEQGGSQLFEHNHQVLPYPQIATIPQDSHYMSGGICQPDDAGCYTGSTLQAPDLLPQDQCNNAWCETSPQAQGTITDQNFLVSGHHYGINTVGQSLRNANRQLRSDPLIPKVNVGPWSNSNISPDDNRKGFEIEA